MLSPSDIVAFFTAIAGSLYSAHFDLKQIPNTLALRFTTSFQASICFLLAFAYTQYLSYENQAANSVAGVKWTAPYLTTPLPVFIYMLILAVAVVVIFHSIIHIANRNKSAYASSWTFAAFVLLLECVVAYHALTLEIAPANKGLI